MTIGRQIQNLSITLAVMIALLPVIAYATPIAVYHYLAQTVERNTNDIPAYQTADLGCWKGSIPTLRRVSVLGDIPEVVSTPALRTVGNYTTRTAEIVLLRGDTLTPTVLRHEYGHALLFDVLVRECGGDIADALRLDESVVASFSRTSDITTLPTDLRAIAREYQSQPTTIYGNRHFTTTFGEYVAQSFSRYCAALIVPVTTAAWLRGVEVGQQ